MLHVAFSAQFDNEFIGRLGPTDGVMFFIGPDAHLS